METPRAEIRTYHGAPALFVDGKPVPLHVYSKGVGLSAGHHKQFAEIGVQVYELSGQNVPPGADAEWLFHEGIAPHAYCIVGEKCGIDTSLCWTGSGAYDYTWVDRSIDEALRGAPEAYIIPRVFASLQSAFHTAHWQRPEHKVTDSLLNDQWSEFFRMGAPFDIYDLDDLAREDFPQHYKCYVFLNAFYTPRRIRQAIDRLKRDGKTLVWFGAAGAVTDEIAPDQPSIIQFSENASGLTGIGLRLEPRATPLRVRLTEPGNRWTEGLPAGMRWGIDGIYAPTVAVADPAVQILAEVVGGTLAENEARPGWSVKTMRDWTSIHFLGPNVPSAVLRRVLAAAGCHIYLASDDNLYMNRSYLGIHAPRAGRKEVSLPSPAKIVNLVDPSWLAREDTAFGVDMGRNETALFSLESP